MQTANDSSIAAGASNAKTSSSNINNNIDPNPVPLVVKVENNSITRSRYGVPAPPVANNNFSRVFAATASAGSTTTTTANGLNDSHQPSRHPQPIYLKSLLSSSPTATLSLLQQLQQLQQKLGHSTQHKESNSNSITTNQNGQISNADNNIGSQYRPEEEFDGDDEDYDDEQQQPNTFEQPAPVCCGGDNDSSSSSYIPRANIVPCRARGMPSDHNFKEAHFIIPTNVTHGQGLVCSHKICRKGGIKFLYCFHCGIPVSKRTFRSRHKFCGVKDKKIKGNEKEDSDSYAAAAAPSGVAKRPVLPKNRAAHNPAQAAANPPPARQPEKQRSGSNLNGIPSQANMIVCGDSDNYGYDSDAEDNNKNDNRGGCVPSHVIESDRSAYASRLASQQSKKNRNDSRRSSSGQVNRHDSNVLDLSLPAATDRNLGIAESIISGQRRKRWSTLLAMRPDDAESDQMSAWLMNVLSVSEWRKAPSESLSSSSESNSRNFSEENHSENTDVFGSDDGDDADDDVDGDDYEDDDADYAKPRVNDSKLSSIPLSYGLSCSDDTADRKRKSDKKPRSKASSKSKSSSKKQRIHPL